MTNIILHLIRIKSICQINYTITRSFTSEVRAITVQQLRVVSLVACRATYAVYGRVKFGHVVSFRGDGASVHDGGDQTLEN